MSCHTANHATQVAAKPDRDLQNLLPEPSFSQAKVFHHPGTSGKEYMMRNFKSLCVAACCGILLAGALTLWAASAGTKTYQVTGPVLEVTPTTITVQKGNDKWELLRDQNTKVTGDLKTGAKVTIVYRMVAEEVEVKAGKK